MAQNQLMSILSAQRFLTGSTAFDRCHVHLSPCLVNTDCDPVPEAAVAFAGLVTFVPLPRRGCFEIPESRATLVAGLMSFVPLSGIGCFEISLFRPALFAGLVFFTPLGPCFAAPSFTSPVAAVDPELVDASNPPSCCANGGMAKSSS